MSIDPRAELTLAAERLERIAAAIAAGDEGQDIARLAEEALVESEAITRLLPTVLECDDEDVGG